jgi:hypothetical protein
MKHVVRVVAHWALLTHIYLSMAGFTLAVLFGVTGVTLNHQDFGLSEPQTEKSKIALDKSLVEEPDQAAIEQCLRQKLGIRSPTTDYHDDPEQIQVTFAAPGGRTIVTINRKKKVAGFSPGSAIFIRDWIPAVRGSGQSTLPDCCLSSVHLPAW